MLYVLVFIVAFGIGLGCGISDLGSKHDEPDVT
jgi:predicted transporter